MRVSEDDLSKPDSSNPKRKRNLLVAWYGSLNDSGTIGDLLSVQTVTNHLLRIGHHVSHATSGKNFDIKGKHVDWRFVSPYHFDAFIFVCGPILKQHPSTQELFEKFAPCKKIAVGISLLPKNHFNYHNPFDHVLAREGTTEPFADVAILAPEFCLDNRKKRPADKVTIGLAMRGPQNEYGTEACLSKQLDKTVNSALNEIKTWNNTDVIEIENHLQRSGRSPREIEDQYRSCDLIISSRFHGCMIALRHLVPFIAIDQIKDGAKVSNLVGETGWSCVYRVDKINFWQIASAARILLSGAHAQSLSKIKERTKIRAQGTLSRLDALLENSWLDKSLSAE
jgi:hypothetical protein